MPENKTRPFRADANPMASALAVGHKRRKGHALKAEWVRVTPGSEVWELSRLCCPLDTHVTVQVGR